MTEDEYLSAIRSGTPDQAPVPSALLELADSAVAEHPTSVELWLSRGHLIQVGEADTRWPLEDSLRSYERAAAIAPNDPRVQEALGYWYDVVDEQLERAGEHFTKALENGGGIDSYIGLARVAAQRGMAREGLELLTPAACPHHDEPEVQQLIKEIESGQWAP